MVRKAFSCYAAAAVLVAALFSGQPSPARGIKPEISDFENNVAMGMRKTEVIDALGSPAISRRWNGKDRWIYHFYSEEGKIVTRIEKEVHFRGGIVVYKGDPPQPKGPTAEEQDRINLEEAIADEEAWKRHQQQSETARKEYEEWVMKIKDLDDDQNTFVPRFQNVD